MTGELFDTDEGAEVPNVPPSRSSVLKSPGDGLSLRQMKQNRERLAPTLRIAIQSQAEKIAPKSKLFERGSPEDAPTDESFILRLNALLAGINLKGTSIFDLSRSRGAGSPV